MKKNKGECLAALELKEICDMLAKQVSHVCAFAAENERLRKELKAKEAQIETAKNNLNFQ